MKRKSFITKPAGMLSIALSLTMFTACNDRTDFYEGPRDSGKLEAPLDFDWSVSQDINVRLKSDVTTRIFLFEDADAQQMIYSKVLEADKTEDLTFTALKTLETVYLAYLNKEGKMTLRPISLAPQQTKTRGVTSITDELTDAAEMLISSEGNKSVTFSPNNSVYGTVLFEDMYPAMGDYDMNDFVLGYKKQYSQTATSETLKLTLQIRAIGGSLPYVPGIELRGLDIDGMEISWTTSDARISVENVAENEISGTPVFRINGVDKLKDGDMFYNVAMPLVAQEDLPYVTITLTHSLDTKPLLDIKDKDLNFFIYNKESGVEIHEKNTPTTRFASNSDEKKFHKEGLVWAFRVEGYIPHTLEGKKIDKAFSKITNWMKTSGAEDNDWLKDFDSEQVVNYAQDAEGATTDEPYINIKEDVVEATAEGGKVEVALDANCDFDVSFGEKGWIYDFEKEDGKLILYFYSNYNGEDKNATVTLTPTTDISKSFSFMVIQKTMAYTGTKIQSNNGFRNNIENLVKANGGVIDDVKHIIFRGNVEKYKDCAKADLPVNVWDISYGKCTDRVFMEWDAATGTIIVSTPGAVVSTDGTCSGMFSKCTGVEDIDLTGLDTSKSTQMQNMFIGCSSLKHIDLTMLNTANVANMSGMFTQCENLETVKLTGLNTSNVTQMKNMFDRCYSLKSVDLSTLSTEKVTSMYRIFWNCQSLEEVKINGSKTSLGADGVKEIFCNCYELKRIDLSTFDFHNALYLNSAFCGCKQLQEVVFGAHNTARILELKNAFQYVGGNGEFTCVNADFSSVNSLENAFKNATATAFNLSGWKTPSVQSFNSLFHNCRQAKRIDLRGWSAESVTKVSSMFNSTDVVEEIDLGHDFNLPADLNMDYLFYCTANVSKHTVVKCSRATYDAIATHLANCPWTNSKTFITQRGEFSIYD